MALFRRPRQLVRVLDTVGKHAGRALGRRAYRVLGNIRATARSLTPVQPSRPT
ncbi:MAG: hypothetical protein ACRDPT_02575 [Streptomycetales bacterium]